MTDDSLLPKSRVCAGCGEEKLLEKFYKHKIGKYGRESRCKACRQQYDQENRERRKQYEKRYHQENKEKIAERRKQYREENKEKIAEQGKQYRQDNKEKTKEYYEANKEEIAEYQKQYREVNKEKIIERQIEKMKYLTENDLLPKSRVCTKCGEEKLLEQFYKSKMKKYGRESHCKLCEQQRKQDNKEHIAKQQKQYREANREVIAERSKQYNENNKEKIAERRKQYEEKNKEKLAERRKQRYRDNRGLFIERTRQYRQDNREKYSEYVKNRSRNDERFRVRRNLSSRLWNLLNRIGKTKNASILTYIGCNIEFIKEHLNSTKKPDWGDDLHIDHIIPCSLFDHTNEEEIKKCWNWRNLRYLPAEENKSKGDTLDMDLVKSYGIEDLLPEGVDK